MQNLSHIIFGNYILTVSLFAWTVAQLLKTVINTVLCGKFQAERLWGAGGMPSSHSALVCALAVSTAKSEGMASPIFAVALVLAAIVMYDATGVRRAGGGAFRRAAGYRSGAGHSHVSRLPPQAFGPSLERRRFLAAIGKN